MLNPLRAIFQKVFLFTLLNVFFIDLSVAEGIPYKYPDPSNSVVSVEVMHLDSNEHIVGYTGSGFIIDYKGYIATLAKFIDKKDLIQVKLNDGRTLKANLVGLDHRMDICLLKIDADNLSPVIIGSTSKLNVTDEVFALQNNGNAFPKSIMEGQVLVIKNNVSLTSGFIQANLPLSLGMSGSPLFNKAGEIVGVNAYKYIGPNEQQYQELSFAIPIESVIGVVDELHKHGRVKWGSLGFVVQDVTQEIVNAFELPDTSGAMVNSVEQDKPAAKIDIVPGDILLAIAGEKIKTSQDYFRIVRELEPGTNVTIDVLKLRSKKLRKFTLIVAEANK